MLKRYFKIAPYLEIFADDTELDVIPEDEDDFVDVEDARRYSFLNCVPTAEEKNQLQLVFKDLQEIETSTKLLQKESFHMGEVRDVFVEFPNYDETLLLEIRFFFHCGLIIFSDGDEALVGTTVFDELIETFPALETNIGPTALIVVSTDFETAIVKVINKNEAQLTPGEKAAIECFKITGPAQDNPVATAGLTLTERIANRKKVRVVLASSYINLEWIPPTSDVVERFFSKAKLTLTDLRKGMNPSTLESVLFLKVHMQLWSTSAYVTRAMNALPTALPNAPILIDSDQDSDF
jgi:hypothetical protein